MHQQETETPNPYATPNLPAAPSYWARLIPAFRRALRHYRSQMRQEKIKPMEELRAWFSLLLLLFFFPITFVGMMLFVINLFMPIF